MNHDSDDDDDYLMDLSQTTGRDELSGSVRTSQTAINNNKKQVLQESVVRRSYWIAILVLLVGGAASASCLYLGIASARNDEQHHALEGEK